MDMERQQQECNITSPFLSMKDEYSLQPTYMIEPSRQYEDIMANEFKNQKMLLQVHSLFKFTLKERSLVH